MKLYSYFTQDHDYPSALITCERLEVNGSSWLQFCLRGRLLLSIGAESDCAFSVDIGDSVICMMLAEKEGMDRRADVTLRFKLPRMHRRGKASSNIVSLDEYDFGGCSR